MRGGSSPPRWPPSSGSRCSAPRGRPRLNGCRRLLESRLRDLQLRDAARADVRRRVPAADARDLHDVTGVRGVDELIAADVDADVTQTVEEDKVAGLEVASADRNADVPLRAGVVRQRGADLRIDVRHEP